MRWQDHDDEDDVDYDDQNAHQHGGDSGVDDAIIAIMTLAPSTPTILRDSYSLPCSQAYAMYGSGDGLVGDGVGDVP